MTSYREDRYYRPARRLYKDSFRGKICGVFAGLGEYLGINAALLRILGIVGIFMSGPVIIFAYFIAALVMSDKPFHLYR
ncbi:PspC domain-containing protein [Emcibacter sp.]|uniref:PspC domain-containing protein n=1 Tax=Emcibacter sp. TaxID=1979954 RepID=UPI002AA89D52|nr:PspC domain-containing protein [Emcibacter sp.]